MLVVNHSTEETIRASGRAYLSVMLIIYIPKYVYFILIKYRIRFNFRGVKLSRIADFSNFQVFIFADAGS